MAFAALILSLSFGLVLLALAICAVLWAEVRQVKNRIDALESKNTEQPARRYIS